MLKIRLYSRTYGDYTKYTEVPLELIENGEGHALVNAVICYALERLHLMHRICEAWEIYLYGEH